MPSKIKLTFLGTASQVPTIKRNHTAILLTHNEENILVDCGEGTQRQFRIAKLNPCKVTKILITHLHGDHTLGLPGFLETLSFSGFTKTIDIYGPKGIKEFVQNVLRTFKFHREYEINVHEVFKEGNFFENKDFELSSMKLEHGTPCNGYCFLKKGYLRIDKAKMKKLGLPAGKHLKELKEGKDITHEGKKFKSKDLVYSEDEKKICFILDTLYLKDIVNFVNGADVLVSEATFMSDSPVGSEHAKEYKHMTAKQAGSIAKQAKVKKLFLTHLSQRYEYKKKLILDEAKKEFKHVQVAKDLDVVEI